MSQDKVTIKKAVYEELMEDRRLLYALQGVGVDNEDGYPKIKFCTLKELQDAIVSGAVLVEAGFLM